MVALRAVEEPEWKLRGYSPRRRNTSLHYRRFLIAQADRTPCQRRSDEVC